MVKDIRYRGLTENPSGYESLDGEMADMENLVFDDGRLEGVRNHKVVFTMQDGLVAKFIHRTSDFTHYILLGAKSVFWTDKSGSPIKPILGFNASVHKVNGFNALGNVLMFICEDGIHYNLWNSDSSDYDYLGNHIPECPISFGLGLTSRYYSRMKENGKYAGTFRVEFKEPISYMFDEMSEANKQYVTSQVIPRINKFIQKTSIEAGDFMFPFLVRYAYRMFDGSLIMHSSPVLMMPSSNSPFLLASNSGPSSSPYRDIELDIFATAASLNYQAFPDSLPELKKWKNVIKSVAIFVSAPLYNYNQEGLCKRFSKTMINAGFAVGKYNGGDLPNGSHNNDIPGIIHKYYQKWFIADIYALLNHSVYPYLYLEAPMFTQEQLTEKIRECGSFYLLKEIPIEELDTNRKAISVSSGYLSSLLSKEVMSDDYQSHDSLIPNFSHVYNGRLNVANMKRKLFDGFYTAAMIPYTNGYVSVSLQESVTPAVQIPNYTVVNAGNRTITLAKEGGLKVFRAPDWDFWYVFYPDNNAKRIYFPGNANPGYPEQYVPLTTHVNLNGSCYFNGFQVPDTADNGRKVSADAIVSAPNKIYTSEIGNPFFFPLNAIRTVGVGEILGICAAVRALSPGQAGQFPLYCFSTDGVWALTPRMESDGNILGMSSVGLFAKETPVSRDVCINPESITSLDTAVVYITDRGIMMLSGSENLCISDMINGDARDIFDWQNPALLGYLKNQPHNLSKFMDFMRGCQFIYDYVNQHIICFNPEADYAYMFSLRSKAWGIMRSGIIGKINSYPEAYAMMNDSSLADLSREVDVVYEKNVYNQWMMTRPMKLDAPDMLKSVGKVIQRGRFSPSHIKQVIYGSRDMVHWTPLSSGSRMLHGVGSPYKYFRILVLANLSPGEYITGCSIDYRTKYTNHLR